MDSDWLTKAFDESCHPKSKLWNALLGKISEDCNEVLRKKYGHGRFSKLSLPEQAAIVEGAFFEMQQMRSPLLIEFASQLNQSVDNALLSSLHDIRRASVGTSKSTQDFHSCIEDLNSLTARAVGDILASSAPEIKSSVKLFLNRPIPTAIRLIMWRAMLFPDYGSCQVLTVLPPMLHIGLSRRCQSLLDRPIFGLTKQTLISASSLKTIIASTVKQLNLTAIVGSDSVSKDVDTLYYLLQPLIAVFAMGEPPSVLQRNISAADEPMSASNSPAPVSSQSSIGPSHDIGAVLRRCLVELLRTTTLMGLVPCDINLDSLEIQEDTPMLSIAASRKQSTKLAYISKLSVSPALPRVMQLLSERESTLLAHLSGLRPLMSSTAEAVVQNFSDDEALSRVRSFSDYMAIMLERCFVGFIDCDCLLFIWDQGFISGFDVILPLIMMALLLGVREELVGLTELNTALAYWKTFCSNMNVLSLRRLLSLHCESDLRQIFDVPGGYSLRKSMYSDDPDNSDVLQAVYSSWQQESTR